MLFSSLFYSIETRFTDFFFLNRKSAARLDFMKWPAAITPFYARSSKQLLIVRRKFDVFFHHQNHTDSMENPLHGAQKSSVSHLMRRAKEKFDS